MIRHRRVSAPLLVPVVLVTLVAGLGRAAAAPEITHYQLANGLEVILAPDPTVASVVVHVWYHVGSKDEVAGKTGFAHLFEHLMFKGSRHVPDGRFDTLLEAAGGWNNGTTNADRTNYFEQVPATALPLALYLEADRMAGLWDAMNQAVLDNQRDVVKNERRQSYENRPYGVAGLTIQQALWPEGHGNHNLTIGTMADLTAASLGDVEAFWRQYYRPSNATLVIVGGFALADARALIERDFGWMARQARPATRLATAPPSPLDAPVSLTAEDKVTATRVSLSFRTDVPLSPAALDLELAARILGGGKSSRLYRRLVMQDRLATSVEADYNPQLLGGELTISAMVRDGVDPAVVRAAIDRELARLRDQPVSADELARATQGTLAELLGSLENLARRAESLAAWSVYAGTPDELAPLQVAYRAVTVTSLQTSARRWLAATAAVAMVVRPPAAPVPAPATGGAK
jgi:zinc protease